MTSIDPSLLLLSNLPIGLEVALIGTGGDLQFVKGVKIGLTPSTQELIRDVPNDDLIQGSIDMICRGLVLSWLGKDVWGHRVEEISRLEHKLAETSGNLRKSLEVNTAYEERLAKEIFEQEITEGRAEGSGKGG